GAHAVTGRRVQDQRAPAAAEIEQALAGLEAELAADVIDFASLRFVEPEPPEIGRMIVVVIHRGAEPLAGARKALSEAAEHAAARIVGSGNRPEPARHGQFFQP